LDFKGCIARHYHIAHPNISLSEEQWNEVQTLKSVLHDHRK